MTLKIITKISSINIKEVDVIKQNKKKITITKKQLNY